jgi:asparagine synthase (glutamine-hydrolysing)
MQDFFGFIDYKRENFPLEIDENKIVHQEERFNFNLFFSYQDIPSSIHLNTPEIFLFLLGTISNESKLRTLLENSEDALSTIQLLNLAYKQWGLEFIKKVEGSFILIIYDKKSEHLLLIKDKVGKIPLNYYQSNDKIIFASSIKIFKEVSAFIPVINPKSLASYLQFGSILQPNTIFNECYKVKSGHYKHFDLIQKKSKEEAYWKLEECYIQAKTNDSEATVIKNAHQLLQKAIEKTYIENKKVALSLSGGYDSSTIASLLQEQSSKKIDTFTIGFNSKDINEAIHAKAIAKHLGTEHHEHYFTGEDALRIIPKLCTIYNEPFAEYAATPTVLTAQLIQENNIHDIFVGDGGDEVFATADDTEFFQRIHRIPHKLREKISLPLKKIPIEKVPYFGKRYNLPTKYTKLLQILSSKNIPKTIEARNILFREEELRLLIQNYTDPIQTTFDEINFEGYHETVDEIIGTYFKTTMTDGELVKSYNAMNHYNITLHTPFLDEQLIAYIASVPSSIKIKKGIKKYVLKEIAHQYIPKPLLARPKSGFDIPFSSWMRKELKELIYEQINEKRLNEDKLFYTSFIINIRDNFYQGNDMYKYKLWRIFIFQLWYENFKG